MVSRLSREFDYIERYSLNRPFAEGVDPRDIGAFMMDRRQHLLQFFIVVVLELQPLGCECC